MDSAGEQFELTPWAADKNKHCNLNMEKQEEKLRGKKVLGRKIMWNIMQSPFLQNLQPNLHYPNR